jgi:eukaryotic-like serine/threonine-protein kinase
VLILGKYRLEYKLGEGGMGSVWAAHHVPLDTRVAIKLIRGEANRENMASRLLQEARAAAKLGHPAIVRVYDVGQTDTSDPFIVMELLEGESLQQRLDRELHLSATEAVRLLLPIADALRAAHAKGIVHRDIKPGNVFLSAHDGGSQPKLVDFGIAKLNGRDMDTHLTQKGVILGSPDYMAPEQARGEEGIDQRADIWSFCVLLYEAVSGDPPFDGGNYHALLRAIVEVQPISLCERCTADAELSTIVETGMAKAPAERWPSMQALGEALAVWLLKQGVFEDAAGNSIDAKWVHRANDPATRRQSRPSFGSIPGVVSTSPGVLRTGSSSPTERRIAGEAPTSVGPVVSGTERNRRRRLIVPLAVAFVAVATVAALGTRSSRELGELEPHRPALAPTLSPASAPRATPAPSSDPEPPRGVESPAATASVQQPETKTLATRPHTRPPRAPGSASPRPSPALDLMAPY